MMPLLSKSENCTAWVVLLEIQIVGFLRLRLILFLFLDVSSISCYWKIMLAYFKVLFRPMKGLVVVINLFFMVW